MPVSAVPDEMTVPRFLGKSTGKIDFVKKLVPEPGPGELLVRVKANALCGSERRQFFGGSEVTPGHEAAGVVADAGPGTHTAIGTPGVIYLMYFCGECRSCKLGFTNQCLSKRGDVGFNKDGGYGPYTLINESIFFPVDEDIPLAEATMLLDVMGTTRHAIERGQRLRQDVESIGIAGAGPVGLGALAMAKILFGAEATVLVSDPVPYRLGLAERLGGEVVDLREQTLAEGVRSHGLDAIDLVIDTSGKSVARQAVVPGGAGQTRGAGVRGTRGRSQPRRLPGSHRARTGGARERVLLLLRARFQPRAAPRTPPVPPPDNHAQIPGARHQRGVRAFLRRKHWQGDHRTMNGEERVKVALIGAGTWGLQHARIFAERPDVDFRAVVGRTLERTRARAEEFGTNYYLDIQEMLESERPDLVSVCLPNLGHFEPTLQVIEAGVSLIVEKPLVFDIAEARTLLDEAAKRGLFLPSTSIIGTPVRCNWRGKPSKRGSSAMSSLPHGVSAGKDPPVTIHTPTL
jgi:threonine 3-dehydrogenase